MVQAEQIAELRHNKHPLTKEAIIIQLVTAQYTLNWFSQNRKFLCNSKDEEVGKRAKCFFGFLLRTN